METLLGKIEGVGLVLVLMIVHLCFPDLRQECNKLCDIPLSSFTSLSKIKTYLEDIRKFGKSSEKRAHILVLGNSSAGKTSFVRTLKKFSECPHRYQPESFLTEHDTHFIETKVMEVIKDIKLSTEDCILTKAKPSDKSEKLLLIQAVEGQKSKSEARLNLTFTDFGGRNVKICSI